MEMDMFVLRSRKRYKMGMCGARCNLKEIPNRSFKHKRPVDVIRQLRVRPGLHSSRVKPCKGCLHFSFFHWSRDNPPHVPVRKGISPFRVARIQRNFHEMERAAFPLCGRRRPVQTMDEHFMRFREMAQELLSR